jgi:hypothetical protein
MPSTAEVDIVAAVATFVVVAVAAIAAAAVVVVVVVVFHPVFSFVGDRSSGADRLCEVDKTVE